MLIFASWKGAGCTEKDFYPDMFLINNCFSFGIYMLVYVLHSRDYYIEWDESEKAAKNLFTKQTERYVSFYTFLIEWHIFELILGKGMDTFSDSIMCAEESQNWIYANWKGSLFMILHIIGTMMGTGMARAVFIKTAKAEGFFGGVEDVESSDEEGESK